MKKRVCLLVMLLALVIMGFTMNVEAAEIVDRGYCGGEGDGKNLTWTLDSDGVLVIEGQGQMKDWTWEESHPLEDNYHPTDWHKYYENICSIVVREGITYIGHDAFMGFTNLSSVNLPRSLTSIGEAAFFWCGSLESIVLPESIVDIEDYTFGRCYSLKNVVLPESVASIGFKAFFYCDSLESIVLPKTLTEIGAEAFWGCVSLGSISLPESLTDIGEGAFENCSSLSSIALPQSLASVKNDTFRGCSSLRSINIPLSVVRIDYTAFKDTDLKDIYYEGTQVQWNAIKGMEDLNNYGDLNATIHYVDYDYEKLNDFVSCLYRNFLKREPDEEGLAAWVDALVTGRGTGAKVVVGFVLSPEYKANSLSDEEYVMALYKIIFNREPDAAGLNSWIAVMENGCTFKKVLEGFINSNEFDNLCKDLGIETGSYKSDEIADQNVKIAAFVARLYRIVLERRYDREGLDNWVSALVYGNATASEVVWGFLNSEEFRNRNLDDTSFLLILFRVILGREPDPFGFDDWIIALERGYTRNQVTDGFLKSAEFGNLCAEYGIKR